MGIAHTFQKLLWRRGRPNNSWPARKLRQRNATYVSSQSPLIIGGCPRSGTTLIRAILDTHPNIACGPESSLLAGRAPSEALAMNFEISADELAQLRHAATDHAQLIELFYTRYAGRQGKPRWAEKSPANVGISRTCIGIFRTPNLSMSSAMAAMSFARSGGTQLLVVVKASQFRPASTGRW